MLLLHLLSPVPGPCDCCPSEGAELSRQAPEKWTFVHCQLVYTSTPSQAPCAFHPDYLERSALKQGIAPLQKLWLKMKLFF